MISETRIALWRALKRLIQGFVGIQLSLLAIFEIRRKRVLRARLAYQFFSKTG